jgi:prolyl-tRNA synthetase
VVEHFDPKNPSTLHDAFQKVAQKIIADANDKSGMVAPIADKKTQPLVAEVAINASKNNAKHLTAQTGAKAVKTAYNEAAPEIALYDAGPQQTTAEALGISTDEDGLYAIKL